jgi:hypothetical protein
MPPPPFIAFYNPLLFFLLLFLSSSFTSTSKVARALSHAGERRSSKRKERQMELHESNKNITFHQKSFSPKYIITALFLALPPGPSRKGVISYNPPTDLLAVYTQQGG